jgi:hypothetical protein
VASGGDEYVRQGMGGGHEVVEGLGRRVRESSRMPTEPFSESDSVRSLRPSRTSPRL